jgi:hypothetical protein
MMIVRGVVISFFENDHLLAPLKMIISVSSNALVCKLEDKALQTALAVDRTMALNENMLFPEKLF